jgi:hypothetical protein
MELGIEMTLCLSNLRLCEKFIKQAWLRPVSRLMKAVYEISIKLIKIVQIVKVDKTVENVLIIQMKNCMTT